MSAKNLVASFLDHLNVLGAFEETKNEPMIPCALNASCIPTVNFGECSGGLTTASGGNPLPILSLIVAISMEVTMGFI